jgi:hypothetical protein
MKIIITVLFNEDNLTVLFNEDYKWTGVLWYIATKATKNLLHGTNDATT